MAIFGHFCYLYEGQVTCGGIRVAIYGAQGIHLTIPQLWFHSQPNLRPKPWLEIHLYHNMIITIYNWQKSSFCSDSRGSIPAKNPVSHPKWVVTYQITYYWMSFSISFHFLTHLEDKICLKYQKVAFSGFSWSWGRGGGGLGWNCSEGPETWYTI